jgi:deoxyribodipyrimidine photo-lyase
MTYSIVWFKRDLRLHDHAALHHASRQGPVLCLYVIESQLWAQRDAANQHYQFLLESLRELHQALREHGGRLHVLSGEVPTVFAQLHAAAPFSAVYAHEETGNDFTYQRDLALGRWCRDQGVGWHEFPQFGVVRRLQDRDTWQGRWNLHMNAACWSLPALQFIEMPWQQARAPSALDLGLDAHDPPLRQRGGRTAGLAVLASFLHERSGQYRGGISSPLSAPTACSRLSPYLTYGCLSLREIIQATRTEMLALPASAGRRKQGLTAFVSRLYWHCHFIQKLESEPELEYQNVHRGYDGLREDDWNAAHFEALKTARTGWPLVDACVVMLRETGWLNFRMRAMLVSVAAYPLWLDWRPVGHWLAGQFLDYEPGIHWSQMQMQSGTTGINTTRIYNPVKQAMDHDPYGHFVRRWLPYMRKVPDAWLFEPWRMPDDLQQRCGVRVGVEIPLPLVELTDAMRQAKARLYAVRTDPDVKAARTAIVDKHASRKGPTTRARTQAAASPQMTLEF